MRGLWRQARSGRPAQRIMPARLRPLIFGAGGNIGRCRRGYRPPASFARGYATAIARLQACTARPNAAASSPGAFVRLRAAPAPVLDSAVRAGKLEGRAGALGNHTAARPPAPAIARQRRRSCWRHRRGDSAEISASSEESPLPTAAGAASRVERRHIPTRRSRRGSFPVRPRCAARQLRLAGLGRSRRTWPVASAMRLDEEAHNAGAAGGLADDRPGCVVLLCTSARAAARSASGAANSATGASRVSRAIAGLVGVHPCHASSACALGVGRTRLPGRYADIGARKKVDAVCASTVAGAPTHQVA